MNPVTIHGKNKRGESMKIRGLVLAVVLTASLGKIGYNGHTETWYDLSMNRVVAKAQNDGISAEYWVRSDGVKMYGDMVIVASHPSIPRYSLIETSLGTGIVLDRHTCQDAELIDIATDWKE